MVATQNPIDLEGTYVLPEAQLDRFLMRLEIGYPRPKPKPRCSAPKGRGDRRPPLAGDDRRELLDMIDFVKRAVEVAPAIENYIVAICAHTRGLPEVRLGVSPRGGLALLRAARWSAAAAGRPYVTPDDVKAMALATLAHRMILRPDAEIQGRTPAEVVSRALQSVPVPRALVR